MLLTQASFVHEHLDNGRPGLSPNRPPLNTFEV